jgi:hypothetical protein
MANHVQHCNVTNVDVKLGLSPQESNLKTEVSPYRVPRSVLEQQDGMREAE